MDWGRGADGWGVYMFGVSSLPKLGEGGFRDLRYMLRLSFFLVGVNALYLFTF